MIFDLLEWRRESGDQIVADIAAFLCTPYPQVRRTPISHLMRMHEQAIRIARLKLR